MTRAARIAELEKASEGLATLTSQRDSAQEELRKQVEETAEVRARLESVQAVLAQRDGERAELALLAGVALESLTQVANRLKGG